MKTKIKLMRKLAIAVFVMAAATFAVQAQEALTLERALSIAETGSPDLKLSLLNLERYQKNLEAQRAALKSRFSLQVNPVNYSKQRRFDNRVSEWYTNENFETSTLFTVAQPILITDGTISLTNEFGWSSNNSSSSFTESEVFFNNLYLNLNQPLFTYNTLKLQLKELELNFENARISYAMQYLNLERNVTEFFYNVYMAQMNLSIAKDELDNTQKSYDIIKNKVEAGLAAKEEEYQAELNLATAKSTLQNNEVAFENAKDQLKLYLGMDLFEDIMILADVSVNPVPVDLDKAIENGLESRMELRQREIDVETSQFDLIRTKSQNEFRGDMNLRFGITGDNNELGNIYQNPTKSPSVGISFNIPIFDWGERKARIAAAEAAIESQELNLNEEKKQIVVDIRQVYRNILNQLNQIELAKQNERNAQLTYEINLERYENGDLTGMDLNLYQNQLSSQKVALSQALINYKIELLNLKIQSLYDFEKNEAIIPEELYVTDNQK
ncbi:TolC family protein [Draconibacterium orientale]|uniref:Membrane protein n=2 Tax=Draconibacterium orientale TaxID=1168034 RepID=A0ABM5Q8H3_9BACT|nr:TolC family protein [Draconibacterium orientale]AHW59873.1 membrane protein [Draconibacterium orientale]